MFFVIFAVGMALVYEHRVFSTRITVEFFVNFVYSMSFYFALTAAFSFLAWRLLKSARAEIKIFMLTYGISFITLYVTSMLVRIYWGHSLAFIFFPSDVLSFFFYMLFLGIFSLPPAVFLVLLFEIDRLKIKLAERRKFSREKTAKENEEKMLEGSSSSGGGK